jgi:cation diffusion facilitator CzcD-associated flavoprotein CzcO
MNADVCIVGAGSSGVAAGKALLERGIAFEFLERGSSLGGMWRYENDNGQSSAYRSLRCRRAKSDCPIVQRCRPRSPNTSESLRNAT